MTGNLTPNLIFDSTNQGALLSFQSINQAIKSGAISSKRSTPDDPDINPHTNKALKKTANKQAKKMIANE
jgi:hypothetical protein